MKTGQTYRVMSAAEERLEYILKAVQGGRYVSLRELTDRFGVNIQTARRDVSTLSKRKQVIKVHGGAMPFIEPDALSLDDRLKLLNSEKSRVAKAAAESINDGDVIFIYGGSTTSHLAPYLRGKQLKVITNSTSLLHSVRDCWPDIEVILTGGYYYPKSDLLLGPTAVKMTNSIRADKAFIGSEGVTEEGLFNSNMLVIELVQAIIEQAMETYLLVDSSKLNKASLVHICGWDAITSMYAIGPIPENIRQAANQAGCRLREC